MTAHLSDADGARIESERTARSISADLARRMGYHPEIGACGEGRLAHHTHYGGEADGLAATVRTAFDGNQWCDIANAADYDPSEISEDTLDALAHIAERDAAGDRERHLGRLLACVGERFSRHTSEADLCDHFPGVSLAGIEREHENVDVTCDAGDAQVYTGTSSKAWYHKAGHETAPDDYDQAVEDCNFDVFVFIRNDEEGVLKVGAKTIANESETSAYAKSGH